MVDTHAHLYLKEFQKDLEAVIERSQQEGITRTFLPNIDHSTIDSMLELEAKFPEHCQVMMGLHPCSVKKDFERELYIVEEWLQKRSFSAIGEIGIDLHWDTSTFEHQAEAFRVQVTWAIETGLPIVIHCRESLVETIDLLEPLSQPGLTGVFHCFTGEKKEADRIIAMGFKLGIGGVVTFKNSGLAQTLPDIALDHLVLETDSPYLAPVPYRGKRNEPAYLKYIAEKVASVYETTQEEVEDKTNINAEALFSTSI